MKSRTCTTILLAFWSTAGVVFAQDYAERFDRLDRNSDGVVTAEETRNAKWFTRLLPRLDRNDDGKLQKSELDRLGDLRPARGAGQNDEQLVLPKLPKHRVIRDIPYHSVAGVDPNLLSLDLYVPSGEAPKAGRPVLIMIHGGGWRRGDKASATVVGAKMRHFVGEGYVFASINYRLSPEAAGSDGVQHPTHAEDCARAIAFLHDNVSEHGGDPNRIHLMGHSAGAHLAGIVGTNERFLAAYDKELSVIKTNVLLDTAALDIPGYLKSIDGRGMTQLYQNAFGRDPKNWIDASPMQNIGPGKAIPPTLLFFGGERMLLHEIGPAFSKALVAAGAPARAIDTVDLDHGQINANVGMIGDPMTELIMRLHAGEDPTKFPAVLPGKRDPKRVGQ